MDAQGRDKTKRQQHINDTSSSVEEWDSDSESEKPVLCCLQGCISATAVGVSFFLGLPTGILLVVQALNNGNDTTLLSVGIILIILPIVILIVVLLLCFNQKRLPSLVFWKKKNPGPVAPDASKPGHVSKEQSKKPSYKMNVQNNNYLDNDINHNNHYPHHNSHHHSNNNALSSSNNINHIVFTTSTQPEYTGIQIPSQNDNSACTS